VPVLVLSGASLMRPTTLTGWTETVRPVSEEEVCADEKREDVLAPASSAAGAFTHFHLRLLPHNKTSAKRQNKPLETMSKTSLCGKRCC
jgi:hypothetical protein